MSNSEETTTTPLAAASLTPLDKKILRDLVDKLSETGSPFCCGGIIRLPPDEKLGLFYDFGNQGQARRLKFPIENTEDVSNLVDACSPSSHGRGDETVFDPSYRLARELKRDQFALTADIIHDSDVLQSISRLAAAGTKPEDGRLVSRLYKLNAYTKEGFFKIHRDTPKSQYHVGTLVVVLPVMFEGGALRVIHGGKEVIFDWKTDESSPDRLSLPWAFLFSDVEHEVLPVISGTRLTLAYDIFVKQHPKVDELFSLQLLDPLTFPLYHDLKAALEDSRFLAQGGKVAIALSHQYPIERNKESRYYTYEYSIERNNELRHYVMYLKGMDATLYHIISSLGIPVSPRVVYDAGRDFYSVKNVVGLVDDDNFAPAHVYEDESNYSTVIEVFYTSNALVYHEFDGMFEGSEAEFCESELNASVERSLIWARKPSKDVFMQSGTYITYGNEANVSSIYSAVALVLDIPPFGEGVYKANN
ncbi:hypothetical protein BU17DRAFT_96722 [Hysterangium stoloniferum]|nr:hypothetical protein BU17DRAFT_96722 [Hysterangium stoloniferum]